MSCFPCFSKSDQDDEGPNSDIPVARPKVTPPSTPHGKNNKQDPLDDIRNAAELEDNTVKSFTFREIATATKNFRQECLLGEGGFGKVFKGTLQATGQTVAVRQLERNTQGNNFVFEISNLSLLRHPNLVKMVGYCAEGEQRFLVYEYLPTGSLKSHLNDLPAGEKPLDWSQRMKIALGVAEALEYLHEKADTTVIYRDLRSSNILLTETMSPKLADYGLANIVQGGNKMHMSVMTGFNGYCAPEFEKNGELTVKSDVYSFGVVLLELITGRKALDTSLPVEEQGLVSWAQPLFKDPSKYPEMADPRLRKGFAVTSLNQAVGVAAMCLMEEPVARPLISDISAALSFLAMAPPQAPVPDLAPILSRNSTARQGGDDKAAKQHHDSSSDSEEEEEDDEPGRNQPDQNDYSSDEYTERSSEEEEVQKKTSSKPVKTASVKKPAKIQSRSDSRSNKKRGNNKKQSTKSESRSESRSKPKKPAKAQPPSDSSSSDEYELPPPQLQLPQPHDEDESSSSDDEILDGPVGCNNTRKDHDHEALDRSSSDEEEEEE